ncbi:nickel transporter [Streptomyces sp. NBC_01304]|uniref:nickel transporter n=1 Tax=Streptomyces sp. NBC_01304 TaxID=2903818 RepID=UPI003FA35F7F
MPARGTGPVRLGPRPPRRASGSRRIRRRLLACLVLVLAGVTALVLLPVQRASAHPLGNFTVSRYDGLVASPGRLRVEHVEDLAEIPARQARPAIDRAGRGSWARARCADAAGGMRVTVDGRAARVRLDSSRALTRPGQAGLSTLRVECRLSAALPAGRGSAVRFDAGDDGPGWREITAQGDRMTLAASDVPKRSVSGRLTTYPQRLLSSPPHRTSAALRLTPGGPSLAAERPESPAASVLPRGADRWTQALTGLVARHDLTVGVAALALATALLLGALHALAPGHGKTLMAATAAAGGRSSLRDVLALGASVTVTHTLGVLVLGAVVTAGSAATPSVVAWLGLASGALVTLAGVALVRRAWGLRRAGAHGHHGHGHTHDHGHGHTHHHGLAHDHEHLHPKPRLRDPLLLGLAGGLVPSPSAVVVLVGAAALGQAWFGFLLVLAYGAGLALTLTLAGLTVVRVGGRAARLLDARRAGRGRAAVLARRALPLGTACVVVALGCGLVLKGAATALG